MRTFKNIGARIKNRRKDIKLTQTELARKLNMSDDSRTTITKWENGGAFPDVEKIDLLCSALDCDVGYLFSEYDEPSREVHDVSEITGFSPGAASVLVSPERIKSKVLINQLLLLPPELLETIADNFLSYVAVREYSVTSKYGKNLTSKYGAVLSIHSKDATFEGSPDDTIAYLRFELYRNIVDAADYCQRRNCKHGADNKTKK